MNRKVNNMRFALVMLSVFLGLSLSQVMAEEALENLSQMPPEKAPENTPEKPAIFLPEIVSLPDRYEFGSVFNKKGTEFYFGVQNGGWSDIRMIKRTQKEGKEIWSEEQIILGSPKFSANDPFLSNDGQRLYFISERKSQYDIGYISRKEDGSWDSAPIFLSAPINSSANEYYISFTASGDMVFASNRNASRKGNFDIYLAKRQAEGYAAATAFPKTINTGAYEADAFIAPDGSYMIFSTTRRSGLGRGDLYISFASDQEGGWTKAVSMGAVINTAGHELCPFVTADGKQFFYTSGEDIYWVDAKIIETFRSK